MIKTYFLRGTIIIRVLENVLTIQIAPCAGFLTPDKPHNAIAFPVDPLQGKTGDAKLMKLLDDKHVELQVEALPDYIPSFLVVAAQQKPIEIRFDSDMKIVGFVFPAR